jgi:hypothetical protein
LILVIGLFVGGTSRLLSDGVIVELGLKGRKEREIIPCGSEILKWCDK